MIVPGGRPLVIAHRCGSWPDLVGEQTLAHVERAILAGADFVEVDLRQTADGVILCHHDEDLGGRSVAQSSLAQLQAQAQEAGLSPLMTLSDLLAAARGRIRLDLEIKLAGFEAGLLQQVRAGFEPDQVVYKSFEDSVVATLKTLDPTSIVGLLLGVEHPRFGLLTRLGELFPGLRLYRCGADFVSPNHQLLRLGFVRRSRLAGRGVLVWTVNEAELMEALLPGVDGVITDQVERCLELRG